MDLFTVHSGSRVAQFTRDQLRTILATSDMPQSNDAELAVAMQVALFKIGAK